ncbi:MAG: glycoside hydrolase family 15 protein [Bdellovibrionales bacterium]
MWGQLWALCGGRLLRRNPWFLTTLAIAEHHLLLAKKLKEVGRFEIDRYNRSFYQNLIRRTLPDGLQSVGRQNALFATLISALENEALKYFRRVQLHTDEHGSLWEQMDRNNGFMLSARDLTWSYAAYITAYQAYLEYLNEQH